MTGFLVDVLTQKMQLHFLADTLVWTENLTKKIYKIIKKIWHKRFLKKSA